ncbi:conserved hypothetical protein [Paenibacillus curdlanolyticus YK9]|uniref:Uncharacterized protein n=1 Tax=Paenibacillus curdlanolyticus YK9 TaxID=717606 RepID=E0IBP3_9BACL|nr:hypothetical protein [Paenibacillus curdlanolyticus]EFM10123.1 conserved hypothetical protein [Paenibacillus curdlanolyticus YK9]
MTRTSEGRNTHLFQVEILVEGETNAKALEQLLHVLNGGGFPDFRILSGSELGQLIDRLQQQAAASPAPTPAATKKEPAVNTSSVKSNKTAAANTSGQPSKASAKPAATTDSSNPLALISEQFRDCMKQNKLIRLKVNKGMGVTLNIPGRIINLDEESSMLTVYHVDEKQVYTFKLNEIDDYSM